MNLLFRILYFFLIIFIAYGCIPFRNVVYFQRHKTKNSIDSLPTFTNQDYEFKVAPYDVLSLQIDGVDEQSFGTFKPATTTGGVMLKPYVRGTFVNKFGQIELPYAGKIKISGLTLLQAADTIRSRLLLYVVDSSLIYVQLKVLSFQVTVIGEVTRPGIYEADNEFITLTDLLAQAGDLTVNSNRKNIKLIRTNRETKATTTYRLDLTKGELIHPIISRLQPYDVIYVEPLPRKQLQTVTPYIGITSAFLSLTALLFTIINRL